MLLYITNYLSLRGIKNGRHLKERSIYSHKCNNFNKIILIICLWQKYQRSLQTVDLPSLPLIHLLYLESYGSLKSQHRCENSSESHCVVFLNC